MASLKLFGGASIESDSGPISGRAAQRHRLALLALLAVGGGMRREKVITFLWPETDTERGRRLLSDSVYRINQALGEETITAVGDELRLATGRLPSDIVDFELALREGRTVDAVALYAGPFLDGFFIDGAPEFDAWVERERARLARQYAAALEEMAEQSEHSGDSRQAAQWWYRLASQEPLSARIALRLMRALDAAGDRAAAIGHARIFEVLYRQTLDADPDPAVAALAEQLRSAPVIAPPSPAAAASSIERDEAAPTEPAAPASELERASPSESVPAPQQPRVARRRAVRLHRPLWPVTAGLLLVLAVAAGLLRDRSAHTAAPAPDPAVAVLPFADYSPGRDHEYFASGVMEEVTGALTRVDGLRVVAPTGVAAAGVVDVQAMGQRLGVDAVLQGSVTRWGDSVRINAKLVRVADRAYLWSETYTSRMGSIFAIQDSISRAIGATLTERLVGPRPAVRAEATAAELEAYNLYLKGRFAWHRRTQESLASAASYFEQAVNVAPANARAHAGLADVYAVQGFYDYRAPQDAFPRAEAEARRALVLDPALAQPYATLGYVNLYYHWNWPEAERAFQRAVQLAPSYSTAHQWQANYFTAMGRFAEAELAMRRAMELDPLSLIANAALGWIYYNASDYARAIEQCNRTLELDPSFALAYLWSGLAHEQLGQHAEAIRLLEKSQSLSPGSAIAVAALAHAHATAGRPDRARALLRGLLATEERYVPAFEVAKVHLALGEREMALHWLERAYVQRSHSMVFLRVDPQLAPLRADPRFQKLLRQVGRAADAAALRSGQAHAPQLAPVHDARGRNPASIG